MARRKITQQEESSEGAPEWITTYSDLVTLLLTFFILLFSMATIDKQKFEEVAYSLRSTLTNISAGELFSQNKGKAIMSMTPHSVSENAGGEGEAAGYGESELEWVTLNVKKTIEELELDEHIKVVVEKDKTILRIDSIILFDSGKAEIMPTGSEVLVKLGTLLKTLNNEVNIHGHTDNVPIVSREFPSNWELSTKRATNIVKLFINNCGMKQEMLSATGNAEFKPIASNDTEVNRQKNRRIDIVIIK